MSTLQLYFRFVAISVNGQMQYRGAFLLMTVGMYVTTGVEVLGIWALFDRFGNIKGWTFEQIALFYGCINVAFALTEIVARGFDRFGSHVIRTGDMDRLLVRPRGTLLQVAAREFPLFRLGRLIQGMLVLTYAFWHLEMIWSPLTVWLIAAAIGSMTLFFYAIFILQATLSYWTTESLEVMNTLTHGGIETGQYPIAIYHEWFQRFFTFVIPLACVAYFPLVGAMRVADPLGTSLLFQSVVPLTAVAFLALAIGFWNFGVRHYKSTGS